MSKNKGQLKTTATDWSLILWWSLAVGLGVVSFLPLLVSPLFFFPYITGKVFLFRLIVPLLLGGGMALILLNSNYKWRGNYVLYILWTLVGWALVAALLSPDTTRSLFSNFERMEGWLTLALVAGYACLLPFVFRSQQAWIWFLRINLLVGFLVAFIGLKDSLGLDPDSFKRLESTLGNAAYLGAYAMSQVFIAGLLLLIDKHRQVFLTWIYILLIPLQIWIVYLTATRGAMLGLLAGGLLFLLLFLWQLGERKYKYILVLILGLVLMLGSGFYIFREAEIIQNRQGLSRLANISLDDTTTRSRLMIWSLAVEGVKERPIVGWGPDSFRLVFDRYYDSRLHGQEPWFDRSHNIFIDWLTGAGLPGLLLYLTLFASLLYAWWLDSRFKGLVGESALLTGWLGAYVVQNIFVFDNLSTYLMLALLIGWTGYRLGIKTEDNLDAQSTSKKEIAGWFLVGWLVLWLLFAYWLVLQPAQVAYHLAHVRGYQNALAKNPTDEVIDKTRFHYEQLLNLWPVYGQTEMTEQLILGLPTVAEVLWEPEAQMDKLNKVESKITALFDKNPDDVRLLYFYANWLRQTGRLEEAIVKMEKAVSLSPDRPLLLSNLASLYLDNNQIDKAKAVIETGRDLAPGDDHLFDLYALLQITSGQLDEEMENKIKERYGTLIPDDSRYINAYLNIGRLDLVKDYRRRLYEQAPEVYENHLQWAMINYASGDKETALAVLEKAKTVFPNQACDLNKFIEGVRLNSIKIEY